MEINISPISPMKIVNLTPHPITVLEGPFTGTHPSAGLARVDWLPDGPVTGLPEPAPDTRYVVSVLVAEALLVKGSRIDDILVPGEQVRDEQGRIIGCQRLTLPHLASPAAAELHRRAADDERRDRVTLLLASARVGSTTDKAHAGVRAPEICMGHRYTPAHQAAYIAGRAEGLGLAVFRAQYDGRHALADALADAIVDPLAGSPRFVCDVSVPTPVDDGVMVDWIEGGARRRGRLHRGGGRRWLALEGCELRPLYVTDDYALADALADAIVDPLAGSPRFVCDVSVPTPAELRPLYVTDDEADDIIYGSPKPGGDFNLLWDASRRDERLAARKAAAAAKMEAEAAALLNHAKAMRGE